MLLDFRTEVCDSLFVDAASSPQVIENNIRHHMSKSIANKIYDKFGEQMNVLRHRGRRIHEYSIGLHVFTNEQLKDYVQYRIQEALNEQ